MPWPSRDTEDIWARTTLLFSIQMSIWERFTGCECMVVYSIILIIWMLYSYLRRNKGRIYKRFNYISRPHGKTGSKDWDAVSAFGSTTVGWVQHPHISVTLIRIFECLEKTTRGNRIELRTADPCLSSVVECITWPCQPLLLCYFPIIPQTTDPIWNSSTRVL
jgi:hypothetical protein